MNLHYAATASAMREPKSERGRRLYEAVKEAAGSGVLGGLLYGNWNDPLTD